MADIISRLIIDDRQAIAALKNYNAVLEDVEDTQKDVRVSAEATFRAPLDDVQKLEAKVVDLTKELSTLRKQQKQTAQGAGDLNEQMRAGTEVAEGLGGELGSLAGQGKQLQDAFRNATGSGKGFRAMLTSLKGAIISTGIGALVVLIGNLAANFLTSEKGGRALAKGLEFLGLRAKGTTEILSRMDERIKDIGDTSLTAEQRILKLFGAFSVQDELDQITGKITDARKEIEDLQSITRRGFFVGPFLIETNQGDIAERNDRIEELNGLIDELTLRQSELIFSSANAAAAQDELGDKFDAAAYAAWQFESALNALAVAGDEELDLVVQRLTEFVEVADLEGQGGDLALPTQLELIKEKAEEVGKVVPDIIEGTRDLEATFNNIADVSGLAADAIGSFADFFSESIQLQIDANQELIDSYEERLDVLKDTLADERALQDAGQANAVEAIQTELAETERLRTEALERNKQLRAQELSAKLAADSAAQISSVATAAANFFAGGASTGNPIVGVALAVAAIASMFAILGGIRARAQALQSESFSEGGFIGKPGTSWRSDKYNRGHRVEGSNVVLGGDEYVINGRTTQLQRAFLEQLNAGDYDHLNMAALMRDGFGMRDQVINRRGSRRQEEALQRAMDHAVMKQTAGLIGFMKKQTKIVAIPPGSRLLEYNDKERITSKYTG